MTLVERLRAVAKALNRLDPLTFGRRLTSYIPRMGMHRVDATIDAQYAYVRDDMIADITEAADTIERLRAYAEHEPSCPSGGHYPLPYDKCTCGLSELLKENTDG